MTNRSVISIAAACVVLVSSTGLAQHQGHTMPMPTDSAKAAPAPKKKTSARKKPAPKKKIAESRAKPVTPTVKAPVPATEHDTSHHMMANPTAMQHDSSEGMKAPGAPMKEMAPAAKDTMSMEGMEMPSANHMMTGPLGISMNRMGSGTTWIPDAVGMPSRHHMKGEWEIMTHGFAFAQHDKQNGLRGDEQFGSLNWIMLMASRKLAGGNFQARTMLSLDALTVTEKGYPLLLQTGESFDGQPLRDRQHPHDFWMELGALYQREINSSLAWSIYAAPSGEPALGPVAFMHRPSAMDNPFAPLSHHWQDATHVSFGAVTAGLFGRQWQLEASSFNGREPDQYRWNFDPIKLDSYSARLTVNPNERWSMTAGYGYLKSPEASHPEESVVRFTASALHGKKIGSVGQVASALVWGANRTHDMGTTHSVLAESEAIMDASNTFFGRAELVQKSAGELVVSGIPESRVFNVGALQVGYIREVARMHWATIGVGGSGTLNFVPGALESAYGSRTPTGLMVFVRARPFFAGM